MRSLAGFKAVYLYSGAVDFRKQAHALALVVQHGMSRSPLEEGSLFVFVSRDRRKIRLLYWDKSGFALWWKGLERERFIAPEPSGDTVELGQRQLDLLLAGFDAFRINGHKEIVYERYS
jgi:transposase